MPHVRPPRAGLLHRLAVPVLVAVGLAVTAAPALAQKGDAVPAKRAGAAKGKPKARDHKTFLVDRVVAVINDAVVLASELDVRLLPMLADLEGISDPGEQQRRLDKLRGQVLEDMINEELIVQAAGEARIEVDPKEVDAALTEIKQQNKLSDDEFAEAITAQGFTMAAYKNDLRRQLTRLKAVNQIVRGRVNVTDEDVRARYDAMVRRSESVRAVHLSHLLVAVPDKATDAQLAAAKEKAAAAVQRVRNGEDFATVATEVSDDDATKAGGGDLGWFERGTLTPEWEAVVFSMDEGEVRGPVSGPRGLHVFYVSEIKRTDMKSFEDLKDQIKTELIRRDMDKETKAWIDELRRKAYIDNKL
ncbi:MAG: peptidylprolyl isomerase [Kofleriaceae bacterium]|nr:peptidylprolyl isomerase [Myxococcales bacterium]MCB9564636.1 peptidylprolyl isomerase [Kofleriaceae bacterium]MCB9573748.1 peptidylprolyl isomerase [Kofleriaceae bacterium]